MALSKFSPSERLVRKRVAARLRQQRCRARKRQQVMEQRGYRLVGMGRNDLLPMPCPPSSPTMMIGNVLSCSSPSSSSSSSSSQSPTMGGKVLDSFEKTLKGEHSRCATTLAPATSCCSPMSTSSVSRSIPSVTSASSSPSSQTSLSSSSSYSSLDGRCTPVRNNLSPRTSRERAFLLPPPPPPLTVKISSRGLVTSPLSSKSLQKSGIPATITKHPDTSRLKEVDAVSAMLALSKQEASKLSKAATTASMQSNSPPAVPASSRQDSKDRPLQLSYKMRPYADYYSSPPPPATMPHYHHHHHVHSTHHHDYTNNNSHVYGYCQGWHDSYAPRPMPVLRYTSAYSA